MGVRGLPYEYGRKGGYMTREEAIAYGERVIGLGLNDETQAFCEMAIKALEQEPKTGHWIDHQEGRWIYAQCSECGTVHDTRTNFCPNCGTRMKTRCRNDKKRNYRGVKTT